jgi:DNA primase
MSYDDPGATAAKKYVVSRGFSAADAGNFKIGYASTNWADLYQHLRRKGFSEEEILQTKLVMRSANNGRIYDAMRNRIVFPLVDENGKAVAFTGRSIDPEEKNRYMLTGGTPIFKKSEVAFGLEQAADEIAKTGEIVVVEGQFDAMAMHAAGIKNAVAVSGIDFADNHVAMFKRLVGKKKKKSVVFAFDSDEAGARAAGRAFMALSKSHPDITPYIVSDASGLDPADIYSKDNENGLKTLMDSKKPMAEYIIERLLASGRDIDSIKGAILGILRNIGDIDLQTRLTQRFASQLGEGVESVAAEVRTPSSDGTDGLAPDSSDIKKKR